MRECISRLGAGRVNDLVESASGLARTTPQFARRTGLAGG
jgi:hypothetical protein